jgi:hypothetical protein
LLSVNTPAQILHSYGFDNLKLDGSGQTIAIVTAYDNPNIAGDLQAFDRQFNLPDPVLTKATPEGLPRGDVGWGLETALDVQWAHAVAPGANILLVEAKSSRLSDLLGAVDYARQQSGVVAVSMSWGGQEFLNESAFDAYFTTPADHIGGSGLRGGITFVAASGDSGAGVEWPAVSPNVLAVGGTRLFNDAAGNYLGETAWGGSGGGVSSIVNEPGYQAQFHAGHSALSGGRSTPDVSFTADPKSGVIVFDSFGYNGFVRVGGTSVGAPQWAGLVALADQALALGGVGSLDGSSQTLPLLYQLADTSASTYFHDVTWGSNDSSASQATGLGSPVADQLVRGLAAAEGVSLTDPASASQTANATSPSTPAAGTSSSAAPAPGADRTQAPVSTGSKDKAPAKQTPPAPTDNGQQANANVEVIVIVFSGNLDHASAVGLTPSGPVSLNTSDNLGVKPPDLRTLPFPIKNVPLSEIHIESGGGENEYIPEGRGAKPAPKPTPTAQLSPAALDSVASARQEAMADGLLALSRWSKACAAFFAEDRWEDGSGDGGPALFAFNGDGSTPDPLVVVGGLALVLGGNWGDSSADDVSRRQRFPAL